MRRQKPRTLAALATLALAAACGGGREGNAADSPAAGAAVDTGVRPMNMIDSASRLPADSLARLDSARPRDTTAGPGKRP